MDKKEALNNIIYNLKEIEGTRIRLSGSKTETVDLELALLNQQVINLYRHLQNYQSGMYATVSSNHGAEATEVKTVQPIQETKHATLPETKKPEIHESELKRVNNDATQRKERLKRLEAEAKRIEAEREDQPMYSPSKEIPVAPKGELEDFAKIVEQKTEEEEIARETQRVSHPDSVTGRAHGLAPAELTLNEKLQSGTKVPESLNEKFAQADVKKTLADKMKLSPVTDLKSAIAINQKIAFTNGLFGADDKEFKKAITFLNNCKNFSEAKFYLQSEVSKRYGWDDQDPLVEEFTELVYRKFL